MKEKKTIPRGVAARQELALLHRIIETISYNFDLDSVLHEVIQLVDSIAHCDEIFIYLLRDHELVCCAAKREVPAKWKKIHLNIGDGITGWVAEHRKPVALTKHAYHDARFHLFTNLAADRYEAFLSLPLLHHDHLVGVMNVQYKKRNNFPPRIVRLLQTISYATAGALENARLIAEAAELHAALASRKVIEQAKGKLMHAFGMTEEEAYQWMKRRAMDVRKPMFDIAQAIMMSIGSMPPK